MLLDCPLTPVDGAALWVATVWPDPAQSGGWGRVRVAAGPPGRGWVLPAVTHLGDVVEFGADHDRTPVRWYGFVQHLSDTALILVGPYREPGEAAADGLGSLARWQTAERRRAAQQPPAAGVTVAVGPVA